MSGQPNYKTIEDLDEATARGKAYLVEVVEKDTPEAAGVSKKMTLDMLLGPQFADLTALEAKAGTEDIVVHQADGTPKKMSLATAIASDFSKVAVHAYGATDTALVLDKQVTTINNTSTAGGPRAMSIASNLLVAGKANTIVAVVNGKIDNISWPNNVTWHAATAPTLGTTRTLIIFLWDGTSITGIQGSTT